MPTGTRQQLGNVIFDQAIYVAAVTFPTLGANASATNTLTVLGAQVGDIISWNIQAPPAHLVLDNVYVSAKDTFTLLWGTDGTGISTATIGILFEVMRPENASLGLSALPANLV